MSHADPDLSSVAPSSVMGRPVVGGPVVARAVLAAAALVGLLAGCGAPASDGSTPTPVPTAPAPAPPAPAPTGPAPDPAAPGSAEDAVCAAHPAAANTVRSIARAVGNGPVLPAGVALFLINARSQAARPGVTDPALVQAQAELLAAIDDLDAQGSANLPSGGNPAQDAVDLDATRIVAAVEAIERICAARPPR